MNLFNTYLPASSPLCTAWNRFSSVEVVSAELTVDGAVLRMVDAFLAGKSVFLPGELKQLPHDLRALVASGVLKSAVAESVARRMGLDYEFSRK